MPITNPASPPRSALNARYADYKSRVSSEIRTQFEDQNITKKIASFKKETDASYKQIAKEKNDEYVEGLKKELIKLNKEVRYDEYVRGLKEEPVKLNKEVREMWTEGAERSVGKAE